MTATEVQQRIDEISAQLDKDLDYVKDMMKGVTWITLTGCVVVLFGVIIQNLPVMMLGWGAMIGIMIWDAIRVAPKRRKIDRLVAEYQSLIVGLQLSHQIKEEEK